MNVGGFTAEDPLPKRFPSCCRDKTMDHKQEKTQFNVDIKNSVY